MGILGQSLAQSGNVRVGRNDPCPCGSGRKFKVCCAGKPGTAPPARPTAAALPVRVDSDLLRIRTLREAGRFVEAVRLGEVYTARRPKDPAGHGELGLAHIYAGNAGEALPSFMRAVRLAPDVAENHYNAGWALEHLGRDAEAITAHKRAVAIRPNYAQALDRLGILLLNYDQREQALDCFRGAAAAEPDTVMGQLSHARVLFESGEREAGEAACTSGRQIASGRR